MDWLTKHILCWQNRGVDADLQEPVHTRHTSCYAWESKMTVNCMNNVIMQKVHLVIYIAPAVDPPPLGSART